MTTNETTRQIDVTIGGSNPGGPTDLPVPPAAEGSVTNETLMAGADVTQLCSVLLRQGPKQIGVIEKDLSTWLEQHEYESVTQLKGSLSQKNCADPGSFERAQYMRAISSFPVPPAQMA